MTGNLRVLHVTPFVVPDPSLGGMPQSVMALCVALRGRGHRVTIWASDIGDSGSWQRNSEGDDFFRVRLFKTHCRRLSSLLNTPILPELAIPDPHSLEDFDVVHMHGYWNTFTPGIALACRKSTTALVLQPRGSLVQSGQKGFAKEIFQLLFRRLIAESASIAVALSETERGQLLRDGFADSQIRLIPNFAPVPPSSLPSPTSAREALRIPGSVKTILFLGRLHPAKGAMELLRAYMLVKRHIPESVLLFGGPDEGMLRELEKVVVTSGVQSVRFLGPLNEAQKWLALRAADLYCLPSAFEAFPRVVLEAGAIGTPTILSSHVDLPYATEEGAVLQCDVEPVALARCIVTVLSSEDLRRQLSKKIRNWTEKNFNAKAIVTLVEDAYDVAMQTVSN